MRRHLASTFISVGVLCASLASAAAVALDPSPVHTAGAAVEALAALPAGTFE